MAAKKAAKKTATRATPRRRIEGSIPAQLDALQPGQSIAFTDRIDMAEIAFGEKSIPDSLKKLRNSAHASVIRITDELDLREFAVESFTALNDGKDAVLCCVNVCRIK